MSARPNRGPRTTRADRPKKDPAAERARIAKLIKIEGPMKLPPGSLRLLMKLFMDYVDRKDRES